MTFSLKPESTCSARMHRVAPINDRKLTWRNINRQSIFGHRPNSPVFLAEAVITARKRSLRRLCFYTCVSVHRGGACVAGGCAWQGGMHGRGACEPHYIPQDMVNERAVCILLECILVSKNLSHFKINKNAFQ